MGEIIQFPIKTEAKFGFKRVGKRKKKDLEAHGQLNLFSTQHRTISLIPEGGYFEQALAMDERNDPKAIDAYQKAISEEYFIADAYCNLGILEYKRNKVSEAFDCFTNSLKHDPSLFEANYNLANLYFEKGDHRPARVHYEIAKEIDPEYANLYFNLGLVQGLDEDIELAIISLSKYLELVPEGGGNEADKLLTSLKQSLAANHWTSTKT